MSVKTTFDYESDWVEYFESVLKNEIREDIDNRYKIKANIIETNQSLDSFLKRNETIKRIASKEPFFHNLRIKLDGNEYFFYLNNSDPRFWVIHNIEEQSKIQKIIEKLTTESYLQDKIYLSHETMNGYQNELKATSSGFTLNFDQLFSSVDGPSVFTEEIEEFDDIGFTLQLWPKKKKSINYFIDQFRKIKMPINYRSLNFIFEDETQDVLIKEDLFYDGSLTIHRGKEFRIHLKFINKIRQKYKSVMNEVEERRTDWVNMKGSIFTIEFDKTIDPQKFIEVLNKKSISNSPNPFKINAFFMYSEDAFTMYNCIDTHSGGKFYLQVFPDKLNINLEKNSCGNIIFRLFTNLQRYFSISTKLKVDETEYKI